MAKKKLGKLTIVPVRDVFDSEPNDFTPWLAEDENLRQLGDAIGIDLELEAQEKEVGEFRADLLCKDTSSDTWVLIENQLERTDHTHLGQLITYAAGLEAVTIVWIANRFTDEHRASLNWLNEHTNESINFFGVQFELCKIGSSDVAPRFNVVCQPNEWSKSIARATQAELTDTKKKQLEFWTWFKAYMEEHSDVKCQKAYPQHWMNHPIGKSGMHLASIAAFGNDEPEIRVELVLDGQNAKQYYMELSQAKSDIERELGYELTWHNPEGKNMCRIYAQQSADLNDQIKWNGSFQWLQDHLEAFQRVFGPRVRQLA